MCTEIRCSWVRPQVESPTAATAAVPRGFLGGRALSTEIPDPVAAEPRPLLLSIEAAARVLSVGRTTFYGLLREGAITAVRIGDRPLIPYSELERYTTDLFVEAVQ